MANRIEGMLAQVRMVGERHLGVLISILGVLFVCLRTLTNVRFNLDAARLLIGVAAPSQLLGTALLALFFFILGPGTIALWLLCRYWTGAEHARIAAIIGFVSAVGLLAATQSILNLTAVSIGLLLSDLSMKRLGYLSSGRKRLAKVLADFSHDLPVWQAEDEVRREQVSQMITDAEKSLSRLNRRTKAAYIWRSAKSEAVPAITRKLVRLSLMPWREAELALQQVISDAHRMDEEILAKGQEYSARAEEIKAAQERQKHWRARIPSNLWLRFFITLTFITLAVSTLSAPWTAPERLTTSADVIEGYVVGEQAGSTLVVKHVDRTVVWIRTDGIVSRQVCQEAVSTAFRTIPALLYSGYPKCSDGS